MKTELQEQFVRLKKAWKAQNEGINLYVEKWKQNGNPQEFDSLLGKMEAFTKEIITFENLLK